MDVRSTRTLVLGSGLAGLYAALRAAEAGPVAIVTRASLRESSSFWAQGGVAAAVGRDDTAELHEADTLRVGRGLCRPAAVELLTEEAPRHLRRLRELGVDFDRHGEKLELELALEAGHSRRRIAHAGGGGTGRVIMDAVVRRVLEHQSIEILDQTPAWGLVADGERCYGAHLPDGVLLAQQTILATGGAASLFARSTNPPGSRGQGVAMAWRAGARVADMEFQQFHPTALSLPGEGDCFLISEAVRGEGAHLLDVNGIRFMPDRHEAAELAPRDELTRAIVARIRETGHHCVYLSLAHLDPEMVHERFAAISGRVADLGFDLARDRLPVAPAAHFSMGGILTSLHARTSLPGLLAVGEVACTGVHGANRLASNSLLECLVFADRAGMVVSEGPSAAALATDVPAGVVADRPPVPARPASLPDLQATRELLWNGAGVIRDQASLEPIAALAPEALESREVAIATPADVLVAMLVARAALVREESRGGHFRSDFPVEDPAWTVHVAQRIGDTPRRGTFEEILSRTPAPSAAPTVAR
ncbi:MAG: L-aspartate oxidase [Thermoleophilia bacterium]|nr:L-aspartate oxidase [Thermoleophilia bacterium]